MAMNKNTGDKIDFFLAGILSRLDENINFFDRIEIIFFSGNKEFKATAKLDKGLMTYIFNGKPYVESLQEFRNFIKDNVTEYERMTLIYVERGKKIYIEADGKNVKTKTTDNVEEIQLSSKSTSANAKALSVAVSQACRVNSKSYLRVG